MTTYYDREREVVEPRLHPYAAAAPNQSGYVDFRAQPQLIRSVLEDFCLFDSWPAIQTFYSLLDWLRGPDSQLDSTDCAFRPPQRHSDSNSAFLLSTHGRLFLMFHDSTLNASDAHTEWLCRRMMAVLQEIDIDFARSEGVVGLTLNPVLHTELSRDGRWVTSGLFEHGTDDSGFGRHLMLSFWAYGNDETHAFDNLKRLFSNVRKACESVSQEIRQATAPV